MKLIIDISEEAKRHIDTFKGKFLCGDGFDLIEAIQNGIPLDDVKAEIEQILQGIDTVSHNEYENAVEQGKEIAYENVLSILDNIGKVESEDI